MEGHVCSDEHHQGTATSPTPLKARRRAPRRDKKSACDLTCPNKTQISLSPAFQLTAHSSQQQQGVDPAAPNEHDAGGSRTESTPAFLLFFLSASYRSLPSLRKVSRKHTLRKTPSYKNERSRGGGRFAARRGGPISCWFSKLSLSQAEDVHGPSHED